MKKTITALTLAMVLMAGSAFAGDGIIVAGLTGDNGCSTNASDNDNGGIIVAGFTGIIVAGLTGIIVAGRTENKCADNSAGGLLVSD